jgi:hypothetical protein
VGILAASSRQGGPPSSEHMTYAINPTRPGSRNSVGTRVFCWLFDATDYRRTTHTATALARSEGKCRNVVITNMPVLFFIFLHHK